MSTSFNISAHPHGPQDMTVEFRIGEHCQWFEMLQGRFMLCVEPDNFPAFYAQMTQALDDACRHFVIKQMEADGELATERINPLRIEVA